MKGKLIFNADDFGLTPGVCDGIRTAMEGVVRSTTVMGHIVRPEDAISLSGLNCTVGAHLTLSHGKPLRRNYPRDLLTHEGVFNKPIALIPGTWESATFRQYVMSEWTAQIERLLEFDVKLSHLDSHHHVHMFEPLFPVAVRLAQRYGLALRVRSGKLCDYARSNGVRTPDGLIEGYEGNNNIDLLSLLTCLDRYTGGILEVMCHPGRADGVLSARSSYVAEREIEMRVLGSPQLADELLKQGWDICGYEEVSAGSS